MNVDINIVIEISKIAGKAILDIYNSSDFGVETKKDNSPLTLADKQANEIIVRELKRHYPNIPIVSEEGELDEYSVRKNHEYFWLVDPLDGTKEFINKNGDFTVNIALLQNNCPILGVIYVPVYDVVYSGAILLGAYKTVSDEIVRIEVSKKTHDLIAVGSRSHSSDRDQEVLSEYPIVSFTSRGSSLKFCMVAEGIADIYFRGGPTMEWDTAAGHAIVLAAGGVVKGLSYNKENLLNGEFICKGF